MEILTRSTTIAIPIYKEHLSTNEKKSLQQCLKIFPNRKIIFIAPEGLHLKGYDVPGIERCELVYFKAAYFTNIAGYNRLLLSIDFYEKFTAAEFILIYQLDSWVFSDQLNHWCSRGYSYIGAPWFHNFEKGNDSVSLWAAGNGGFSLRKIDDFIEVLESDKKVFPFKFIWSKYEKYGFWEKLLRLPKMLVQYFFRNNTNHLYELFGENEDHFWSFHAKDLEASFTVANVNTALAFAFECNPKRMFELNHKELPFGIHAWEKYDLPFVETVLFSKEVKDN